MRAEPTSAALAVCARTARLAYRSALVWGAVFAFFVISSALGYAASYSTPVARAQFASGFGNIAGFSALIGPPHRLDTAAGFTAWRSLGVLSVVGGVWAVLTATRLLRGEEETGRWELLLAGRTTRLSATAKALVGLGAGPLVLWAISAAGTIAVGRSEQVGIGIGAGCFFALALVCSAAMFAGIAALTSQLVPTRRRAAALASTVLGISYALRMIADSQPDLVWLRWCSPLGWIEQLRPLTGSREWPLLPIGVLALGSAAAAVLLAGRRDYQGSAFGVGGAPGNSRWLPSGQLSLVWRLNRGLVVGWAVGIGSGALIMGLMAKSVGQQLIADPQHRVLFDRLGLSGSGATLYLSLTFLVLTTLICLLCALQVSGIREEESTGRLDALLTAPVNRRGWLLRRLVISSVQLLGAGVLAAAASWLGCRAQGGAVGLDRLLGAGANATAAALCLLGIGTLAFGIVPRLTAAVTYAGVAWTFLLDLVGGFLDLPNWFLDTSLLHHLSAAPAVAPNWTGNAALVLVGLATASAGIVSFGRRDLALA